ncbi:Hypothetical protein R9X50_00550400 [Acrodontium crateriforme]|uniref:DUF3835 domain-containing protein n=1 Tax=Acrodontium crateriforme TaxID=150365 RepID=A0AAQ3R961_9PEZI|nr:Hypothetical protein R9X50_00550400 [Acrodontium crateriforme]
MDLSRVEVQRQALEVNLQQLRQSLKHWQTLDAEYEGLKEAVLVDPVGLDSAALQQIATTYDGELVDEKTILELTGLDKDSPRSAQQIATLVEKRQEYVQSNIDTLQRRFFDAEAKLEEFDFAASRDSETGLPLTEILEELDDDDNVISSTLSQPEATTSKLVESLRKAGLSADDVGLSSGNTEPLKPAITNIAPSISPHGGLSDKYANWNPSETGADNDEQHGANKTPTRKKSVSFAADTKESVEMVRIDSDEGKKSVSFADKVAVAPAAPLPDSRSVSFSTDVEEIPSQASGSTVTSKDVSPTVIGGVPQSSSEATTPSVSSMAQSDLQKDLRASFKPGEKVIQINDDDELEGEQVVLPENETEEEARTRREMLDYHLHEVGHIVAQINLDDDGYGEEYDDDEEEDDDESSRYAGSTHPDDEDTPYTSNHSDFDNDDDDDDEEDEFGRTKRRVITDEYRKEMMEMEKRLIGNLGAEPQDEDLAGMEIDPSDVRRLVIRDKPESLSSATSESNEKKPNGGKKRVSFAEEVDIAAEAEPTPIKAQKHHQGENAAPVSVTIAERQIKSKPRTFDPDDTPTGPAGRTLAETLVERPSVAAPLAGPSEDDPVMQRRELAAEYYRRRNDMIKQQGGFKKDEDDEEENGELMEERDGKLKKVSRFRAARMKPPI